MIISNTKIITWEKENRILDGLGVLIQGQKIVKIAADSDLKKNYPDEIVLDAGGQILMPGLICAHTHFYGAFSRGLAIPGSAPAEFIEILKKLWWPLDQSLDLVDVKICALSCMIDAIKHGTTLLFDHHASPNAIEGSLEVISQAFDKTGLRGVVCYEVTDRGGRDKAIEGIKENTRMIANINKGMNNDGRLAAMFGMHASLTLSDETLDACRNSVDEGTGFHIHAAEHQIDEFDSMEKSGLRVIDRLKKHQLLGSKTIVAHGVHIDMREAELLAESKTWLSHQPRSNMNNAVGLGNVESMLRAGVNVCLGNDGFSNAMWDEWRTCYLAHKLNQRDPRVMNGNIVTQMGIYNNSELAQVYFGTESGIGTIKEGAQADLILVDYDPITEMTAGNLPWHILFGFRDSMVTMTMVAGNVLMKDRKILVLDEKEVMNVARERARIVWKRYQQQF